jgi:hypothetical protein
MRQQEARVIAGLDRQMVSSRDLQLRDGIFYARFQMCLHVLPLA